LRSVFIIFQDNVSDIVSEGGVQRLYDGYFIVQVLPRHLLVHVVICLFFLVLGSLFILVKAYFRVVCELLANLKFVSCNDSRFSLISLLGYRGISNFISAQQLATLMLTTFVSYLYRHLKTVYRRL